LLAWFQRALLILRECPEFGMGACTYVDTGRRSVLALVHEAPSGAMLALVNLAKRRSTVDLGPQPAQDGEPIEVFSDRAYPPVDSKLRSIEIGPYGYRWIRLRRTIGSRAGSSGQRGA
jgi:maltose alpha-D-glucosyltransferase/alpha-amylase